MRKVPVSAVALTTLLSLALTLGLAFTTDVGVQVSVLIGLITTSLCLGIEAFIATREHLNDIEKTRVASLPLGELSSVPELEPLILRIVASASYSRKHRGAFLTERTIAAVNSFCSKLDDIAHGSLLCYTTEEELRLIDIALTRTENEVRAVATRGLNWWLQPEADAYFHLYAKHSKRLKITRIFLLPKDAFDSMRPVLERHYASGIDTYALDIAQVPAGRRRGVVLFDSALLHRMRHEEGSSDSYIVELCDDDEQIRKVEEYYNYLMGLTESVADAFVLYRPVSPGRTTRRSVRKAHKT